MSSDYYTHGVLLVTRLLQAVAVSLESIMHFTNNVSFKKTCCFVSINSFFQSFIFTTYTLTLGSHFLGYYFDFAKMVLPFTESLASGLYLFNV